MPPTVIQCTYNCGYSTTHRGTLNIHIARKHTHEKTHACTLCAFTAITRGEVKTHHERNHAEPLLCSEPGCSYSTRRQIDLARHLRERHGAAPAGGGRGGGGGGGGGAPRQAAAPAPAEQLGAALDLVPGFAYQLGDAAELDALARDIEEQAAAAAEAVAAVAAEE
jgi:hypothetical protein